MTENIMRDPKRIDRIIELLRKVWYRYPDWRLGQILVNVSGYRHDIIYLEDRTLEKALNEWLENWVEKEKI